MAKTETIEIQKEYAAGGGKLAKYQALILGERSLSALIRFELVTGFAGSLPGALGLVLRGRLYPKLLGACGRNVTFGSGVTLRHPKKIFIGDNVVVDDGCVLDAKGETNLGLRIGNGVFLGRNTILNCKNGDIILEDNANIGSNVTVFSASEVRLGAENLVAAYCYLVGGTHRCDDPAVPVLRQGRTSEGISIGPGGWLGAHVTVFDGVTVGRHAVIGAGSVVNRDVPDGAVAAGVPAKVIQERPLPAPDAAAAPRIAVAVINYNGAEVLADTLDSILKQDYPAVAEVLLVDDGSTDGGLDMVRRRYPSVKVLAQPKNLGPSAARNRALREASTEWVLVMDNDITLEPGTLARLHAAVSAHPDAGMAGVQVRLADEPGRIQYNGANIHYAGGAAQNRITLGGAVTVGALPGAALLIHRGKAHAVGLFDEDFYYGWEDGDFSFRMSIAGHRVLAVPEARVLHRKRGTKGLRWIRYQVQNRWWFMLKNYNTRTLIAVLPAVLLYQSAMLVFFALKGRLGAFLQGTWGAFAGLPAILRKRKMVMRFKTVRDRNVLTGAAIDLMGDVGGSALVRAATGGLNACFALYWALAKRLIR